MYKGEQPNKAKKVDMSIVQQLFRWCQEINVTLAGTGVSCNLHPRTSEPCISCKYRKKCHHYEWERDYIYKQKEAERTSEIRKKKNAKAQNKQRVFEHSLNSEEAVYPCEPFDFACPDRETCNEGQNCPWKEE